MKVNLQKYFKKDKLIAIGKKSKLPTFIYSKQNLKDRAKLLQSVKFENSFKVRYAMKANSHPEIIKILDKQNIFFDASSIYEVDFLIDKCKINPEKISLSSQEPVENIGKRLNSKVFYNACSLLQLENFCKTSKNNNFGLRVNPGVGGGQNNRTTTGGVNSSFGLWHEYLPQALAAAKKYKKIISKLHIHIGSGADPKIWEKVMDEALKILVKMPTVTTLDIGGGYKIHRYGSEQETDIVEVLKIFKSKLSDFEKKTKRKISLEIEPGTFMVAHAGVLVAKIVDIVDTGKNGRIFLKINTGMNDILRPSLYGAQHLIEVLNNVKDQEKYVVVGHNCESGDILTTAKGDAETIEARILSKAKVGDYLAIYDTGAYCASMSAKKYNQFPDALEKFI